MNKAELFPSWKQAVENYVAQNPEPGSVLTRTWLMEQFGIPQPTTVEEFQKAGLLFLQAFTKFRESLLVDHLIDLQTDRNGNYEVIHPKDQTRIAMETRLREITRSFRKMHTSVAFVNTNALTESQRAENTDAMVKIAAMRANVNRRKLLGR